MKIVKFPRGGGKTTDMLVWLLEGHAKGIKRALIVADGMHARSISMRLNKLWKESNGLQYNNNAANMIYTVNEVQKLGGSRFRAMEIGIDDADAILSYLIFGTHRDISIASITEVPEPIGVAQKSVSKGEEVEVVLF